MDTLQIPAYVLALAWIVGVFVSAIKGGIEGVVPATNRWHDLLFTILPVVLSVAAMLGYVLTHGGDRFMAVIWGVLSGCGAIGAYTVHTRTRSTVTGAGAAASVDLSRPLTAPRQPAWAAALAQEAPPASAGTAQPSVAATPPEPPQTPTEAPVGPTVTYTAGPPTP